MNKYEKAYDVINDHAEFSNKYWNDGCRTTDRFNKAQKSLKELVERATPKKVNGDTDDWACPKCDSDRGIIDGKGYCAVCGQALIGND